MKRLNLCFTVILLAISLGCFPQARIDSFSMYDDVRITLDIPSYKHRKTMLIVYALPNGNTTRQTMGKKINPGDDWHFDIQHIRAQTAFLREHMDENILVAYAENDFKSWPAWKQKHSDYKKLIQHLVDTLYSLVLSKRKTIYLNGHSGGGSFIFGYLDGIEHIPREVGRIIFLDSNYGYDSSYYGKLKTWMQQNKNATLTVFAYNDSVALYNGKPVVSEKGGTWYRSHLMMRQFQNDLPFVQKRNDSLICFQSNDNQIGFFFKTNPDGRIYHTQQVELNGFIHSILYRTKNENKGYEYFGPRAYSKFIE